MYLTSDKFAGFMDQLRREHTIPNDIRLLEAFYFDCRIRNLSPKTLECYADRLHFLIDYATLIGKGLASLDRADIQRYIMTILSTVADETVNGRIRVFKRFYNFLLSEGELGESPLRKISLVRVTKKIKPVLSPEQVSTLIGAYSKKTFHGVRNRALIQTFYDAMLRVGELLSMKVSDAHLLDKYLVFTKSKSRQSGFAPIVDTTAVAIHRFIWKHRQNMPTDWLWCTDEGNQLTQHGLSVLFRRLSKRTGIHVYPHLLRHSGATQYLKNGGRLADLSSVLHHQSLTTTQIYIHLDRDYLIREHQKVSPAKALSA